MVERACPASEIAVTASKTFQWLQLVHHLHWQTLCPEPSIPTRCLWVIAYSFFATIHRWPVVSRAQQSLKMIHVNAVNFRSMIEHCFAHMSQWELVRNTWESASFHISLCLQIICWGLCPGASFSRSLQFHNSNTVDKGFLSNDALAVEHLP